MTALTSRRFLVVSICATAIAFLGLAAQSMAEVKTIVDHNDNDTANVNFTFKNVPRPSQNDAAVSARFAVVDGEQDPAGSGLSKLNDGKLPTNEDEASENFFFRAGTDGGRIAVDLTKSIEIERINSYSWHPSARGPQVYSLYASDGSGQNFDAQPNGSKVPESCGWKLVTKVDTRTDGNPGGQYGVTILDSTGSIGAYRYLLFVCSKTENEDPFGNTFFSEIDVIDKHSPATPVAEVKLPEPFITHSTDGACEIRIDSSEAPDLKEWSEQKLAPALAGFYPKLVTALASDGFTPPKRFTVTLKPIPGVAFTSGTKVVANSDWLKTELAGEAVGSLIHEEVHVMQQYKSARRNNHAGWIVEGIPDYLRWYVYEPQSNGARIGPNSLKKARYDASYRVSANFLNFVVQTYDKDLISKLNAIMRKGEYSEDIWKEHTGKTVQELEQEWKSKLELVAAESESKTNAASASPK